MPAIKPSIVAYQGADPFIFASYSHLDAELVYPQLRALQERGLNVWFDEGITPGHRWTEELADAIQRCSVFLLFVTPRSVASDNCINEVQFAMARQKPFLAVHLEPTELPPHLELSISHRQAILVHRLGTRTACEKTADALEALLATGGSSPTAMAHSHAPGPYAPRRWRRWPVLGAVAAVLAVASILGWWMIHRDAPQGSLAVLPFNNYGDPDRDYLAEGLADGLISQLGRLPGLRVASRASSFALKQSLDQGEVDMAQIHDRLNVRHLLEGSVRPGMGAGQLMISVRVVDAVTDTTIWTADWDTAQASVLDIQADIAQRVAQALMPSVSDVGRAGLQSAQTRNPGAYDQYLLGRSLLRQPRSPDVIDAAENHFKAALRSDGEFALAHAGLCETYSARFVLNMDPLPFVMAQKACDRALKLDADQWEVRLSLGTLYRHAGDYPRSLEEIGRAVALAPQEATVHLARGWTLDKLGQDIQAEAAFVRAIELEPGYWGGYKELANFYYDHVEYENALSVYEQALDLVADDTTIRFSIGAVQLAKGDFREALATFELVRDREQSPSRGTLTNLGTTYYYMGCFEEAAAFQKQAALLAPRDHRVWGRLAESCRFVNGAEQSAQEVWSLALELARAAVNQASWENKGLQAIYLAHLGQGAAAREQIAAMWQLHPEESIGHFFEAIVRARSGEPDAARESRSRSLAAGFPPALMERDPDLSPRHGCDLNQRVTFEPQVCSIDVSRPLVDDGFAL